MQGVEETRDGVRYMRISQLGINFTETSARFRVNDEVNGRRFSEALTNLFNRQAKLLINAVRPSASDNLAKHFTRLLNTGFPKLPLKVWLQDD